LRSDLGGYIFAIDRVGAAASVIQLTYDDGNVEILNEDGKVLSKASLGQGASLMFPKTECVIDVLKLFRPFCVLPMRAIKW